MTKKTTKPQADAHQVNTRPKTGARKIQIDPAQVERLASRGLTKQQICACLGICDETLLRRERENVEISEAIKRGRAAGLKEVTNALFEQAMSGNVAASIFYLKNRDPENWKDKVDVAVENNLPAPLVIEVPCIDVQPEPMPELGTKKAG